MSNVFRRNRVIKPKPSASRYKMWEHNSWGNRLEWNCFRERVIVGWMTPKPRKGDYIHCKMQRGGIFVFQIKKVRNTSVGDMFFAGVKDVGYLIEQEVRNEPVSG